MLVCSYFSFTGQLWHVSLSAFTTIVHGLASCSALRGWIALLHLCCSEWVSGPQQSQTKQATIIYRQWKTRDTKGKRVYDTVEWAPSHLREEVHMCVCSTLCLRKWLLCSSDSALEPAGPRGYEGEVDHMIGWWDFTISNDSEDPFTQDLKKT